MGKLVHDLVLDAALDFVAGANLMIACSNSVANRTDAVTTYALADVAMNGTDFTKADGNSSGRKTTIAQKTGVTVDANGTANHVALCNATLLLYATTATAQALTANNTMTFNSWAIEIADPT
jgi:hypothetical protein